MVVTVACYFWTSTTCLCRCCHSFTDWQLPVVSEQALHVYGDAVPVVLTVICYFRASTTYLWRCHSFSNLTVTCCFGACATCLWRYFPGFTDWQLPVVSGQVLHVCGDAAPGFTIWQLFIVSKQVHTCAYYMHGWVYSRISGFRYLSVQQSKMVLRHTQVWFFTSFSMQTFSSVPPVYMFMEMLSQLY